MSYGFNMLFKGNISEHRAYQIARERVTVLGSAEVARKYIKERPLRSA
jgi:hypothetical protein